MQNINTYVSENKQRFLEELMEWLRIPSISADPAYKADVDRAADWVMEKLTALNLDKIEKYPTEGHAIVYAEKIVNPDLPTVLVYGHYDVQPPDPLELWDSPAFEPVIKDDKIYARGACDDKGQLYMHVKALEVLNSMGELPCNVKLVIEGEEEVGSTNLAPFVRKYKDMLAADIILVSDTSMIANDVPSITTGLRGLSYVEVHVTGPNRDLHSGTYGGAVANPINILCDMIASLRDEEGRVTIPGFYDNVEDLSDAERAELAKAPFDVEVYKSDLEIGATGGGEKAFTPTERSSIRPTLDVNGIWGGYTGAGAKTVLPSEAHAKISMRLVPNQDWENITELFKKHFESIAPESVKVVVEPHHGGQGVVIGTDSHGYRSAEKAMTETFGIKPIPNRAGGSIPIIALFKEVLGIDTILFGFGLNSDAIHSPNEHFGIFNYLKGIETIPRFYQHFAS
ncbi:MAG: dipeptidase [Bacteroidia bacterium]